MGIYIFEPSGSTPTSPQGLQQVIDVNSVLNKNNDIDCDGFALSITGSSNFSITDELGYLNFIFENLTGYDNTQNNILLQASQIQLGVSQVPMNFVMNSNSNAVFTSLSTNYDLPANKYGFNIEATYNGSNWAHDFWIGDKNNIIPNTYLVGQYIWFRNDQPRMIFSGKYFRFQHDTDDEDGTAKLEFNGTGWNYTGAVKTTTKNLIVYVDNIEYIIPLLQRN